MQSHYMLFKFRKVNKVNLKLTKQNTPKKKKNERYVVIYFQKAVFGKMTPETSFSLLI